MIFNILLIALVLTTGVLVSSLMLWILLKRAIRFRQAVGLICIAKAMNKFFLTGSGYAAASGSLKIEGFPFYKSLSSFTVFELFSALPWLVMGIYFGAKLSFKVPVFLMIFLALIPAFFIYKRVKLMPFLKDALGYIRQIKYNIYMILPLVLINVFISTVYYLLLFKAFGFQSSILNIFKIVSIAFTIGYFSPTPAGLGFKEGGLIFLLMQHKLSFAESATIAVSDRLAVTGFYAILAFAFGMNIIRAFIKKKFNNQEEGKQ